MRFTAQKIIWINASIALLFIIDRIVKTVAMKFIPREGLYLIQDVFGFVIVHNEGIAYSVSIPHTALFIGIGVVIIMLMLAYITYSRRKKFVLSFALLIIAVGAFSNLIDRLLYGYVVDMIVLTKWPVFNIADLMISAGAVVLVLQFIRKEKQLDER